jgi:hypothetical protein
MLAELLAPIVFDAPGNDSPTNLQQKVHTRKEKVWAETSELHLTLSKGEVRKNCGKQPLEPVQSGKEYGVYAGAVPLIACPSDSFFLLSSTNPRVGPRAPARWGALTPEEVFYTHLYSYSVTIVIIVVVVLDWGQVQNWLALSV